MCCADLPNTILNKLTPSLANFCGKNTKEFRKTLQLGESQRQCLSWITVYTYSVKHNRTQSQISYSAESNRQSLPINETDGSDSISSEDEYTTTRVQHGWYMSQTGPKNDIQSLVERAAKSEKLFKILAQKNQQISQKLQSAQYNVDIAERFKKRFLANISHEVRTPMNGILGMTELLLGTDLNEAQEKYARSISHSTESLLFIVNDILDFSSLQNGRVKLVDNLFLLDQIISDVCSQYEQKASENNIVITFDTKPDHHSPVVGDEFRIRQILCKLIDNAIKFSEEGEIVVSMLAGPQAGFFKIIVEDDGCGIAPEVQKEIFQSFSQGDNSSTRRFGGTGLGLTIAASLANLMNGEITVQSELDKGARFTFTCHLQVGDIETIAEIGKSTLSGIKALVVDDTDTNREILNLQLSQWGIEVHCADSGTSALKMLSSAHEQKIPFKLALLDLNMPDMDGLELAQHIQNAEFSKELKVMMLTSSVVDISSQVLEERGILKSMLKPARQTMLYEAITKVLSDEPSSNNEQPASTGSAPRILLTEDDAINQEVATIMLESMGYDVVIADNGQMAVDTLLQDDKFDLILMDCQMPVMDGFNATRKIRENKFNIPIIALTANAMQGDKEQCLEAGMDDYLTKPISKPDLCRVVTHWTSKSNQQHAGSKKTAQLTTEISSENIMNIEIDESALDAIRSLQRPGKPDILARIVNMYVEKSPELISAIEEGIAANDSDKVKMAAHTLKSSSAYVGASALADVCGRVESKAANDELNGTQEDVALISSGYESVVSQIKQYG